MKYEVTVSIKGESRTRVFVNSDRLANYIDSLALFKARVMMEKREDELQFSYSVKEIK